MFDLSMGQGSNDITPLNLYRIDLSLNPKYQNINIQFPAFVPEFMYLKLLRAY